MKKIQLCALMLAPLCLLIAAAACGKDTVPMRGTQEKTVTELPEETDETFELAPEEHEESNGEAPETPQDGDKPSDGQKAPKQGGFKKGGRVKKPEKPHPMPPVHGPDNPFPIRPVPIPEPNPKPLV